MKIKIGYDTKSIDNAIKQIEEYRKRLIESIPTFLRFCAERVAEHANEILHLVGIGANVESEIISKWEIDDSEESRVILRNDSEKATYVEFGVGEIGAREPHDLAGEQGYLYDIPSRYKWTNKYGQTHWYISFHSLEDIDLAQPYYEELTMDKYAKRSRKYIRTQGQPATMFLFNAMMDFIDEDMHVPIAKQVFEGI